MLESRRSEGRLRLPLLLPLLLFAALARITSELQLTLRPQYQIELRGLASGSKLKFKQAGLGGAPMGLHGAPRVALAHGTVQCSALKVCSMQCDQQTRPGEHRSLIQSGGVAAQFRTALHSPHCTPRKPTAY